MRAALVVNKVSVSLEDNLENIISYINKASDEKADLVLFPEAAVSGLNIIDEPNHDIDLGISIDGNMVKKLCETAKDRSINVAIGILEREENCLYDTAVLINRNGEIGLKYRRISKGWRDPKVDSIYKEGNEIKAYETDIGKVCFLICGDLFDDNLVNEVKKLKADYLLFPFARSFVDRTYNKDKWYREELKEYLERVRMMNTRILAVNYLDDLCFGGAFTATNEGEIVKSFELGREGIMIVEL